MHSLASSAQVPFEWRSARAVSGTLAALFTLVLVNSGCPRGPGTNVDSLPQVTTADPDAEHDINEARAAQAAGDSALAMRLYQTFLREHPNDPLVPIAQLNLGLLLMASGDVTGALPLFARVATSTHAATADRGRFYRGIALELGGSHAEARTVLNTFVGRTVDPADTAMLLRNLASAEEALGAHGEALTHLDALLREPISDLDRAAVRARIDALVTNALSPEDAQNAADTLSRDGYSWSVVAQRALAAAFEGGNMTRVRALGADLRARGVELPDELQSMTLRASLPDAAAPDVIGVILPLSGRAREIGQRALRALMLASGVPSDRPLPPGSPRIVYRDTMGDPAQAVRAVEDLVSLHRAIAIIGPIDGQEALAAAQRAQELGVPLITLTPAPGITRGGAMIFRLFSDAVAESTALIRAARNRGARSFVILHSSGAVGTAMAEPFSHAIADNGGAVIANVAYAENATSFSEQIAQLRTLAFDSIVLADTARTTAMLVPALAAAGIWSSAASAGSARQSRVDLRRFESRVRRFAFAYKRALH
ncbi:MAG: ABC transporter substrate-binding protein [Sandaracinaceae bacterium]|nr:ABC transporter substrate-binding protein [Sandaracinaceae bacterium]